MNPSMTKPQEDAEFWPLSGGPYFYVVLSKTHLARRFQLVPPVKLCLVFPSSAVPTKFVYRGKTWDLHYYGDRALKKFNNQEWGKFAIDNNLVVGDACVFELMECSKNIIKFKVQILRRDFPSELMEKAEGFSLNNPISLE